MNILWVNQFAIAPDQAGGTRHFSFAKRLVELGHDVTIVASDMNYLTRGVRRGSQAYSTETRDGVRFHWLGTGAHSGTHSSRALNLFRFAATVLRRPGFDGLPEADVVIGSSPSPLAALAALRVARRTGAVFVLEVRDLWPQTLVEIGNLSPYHPFVLLLGVIQRRLYGQASRIITLLPASREEIVKRGGRADRITCIPNGVDLHLRGALAGSAPVNGRFDVVYAGAHGTANALDAIVDCAAILEREGSGITFHLYGDGPEKERLARSANDRRAANIRFHDPVPKARIYEVLAAADACVLALKKSGLYRHGFSLNKLWDYMAAGRPIVFAADAPRNVVDVAGCGFTVPAEDPRAMADALTALAGLSARDRDEMGQRGRRYVEEHHDVDRLAGTLEGVLNEALAGH
jgi:glycosyltransferase involved in cell wall biosynthesis